MAEPTITLYLIQGNMKFNKKMELLTNTLLMLLKKISVEFAMQKETNKKYLKISLIIEIMHELYPYQMYMIKSPMENKITIKQH